MFSRILTKLIDEAIVPAVALVAARVLGVIFVTSYFGIPLANESSFLTLYFSNKVDFLKVNSYSTLFMYFVVFLGGVAFLVKSRYFHDTHISPPFAAKVFSSNLGNFIQTSFDIYSEGSIWLLYSFLMTLVLGVELYFRIVYPWVFILSLALSILLTLIFVSDVEREVTRKKNE